LQRPPFQLKLYESGTWQGTLSKYVTSPQGLQSKILILKNERRLDTLQDNVF